MATVGELSKKFASQLQQLQAIFPDWEEQDLVFALQDSKGNVEDTVLAISEGRTTQFTQASKKKPAKTAGSKVHGGRNAGEPWEEFSGGGRGGRGGGRGGRGGGMARGMAAVRGARIGRAGARAGRGGYGNVNGGAKKSDAPIDAWPTSTATTADGWSSQVEQAEAASAHEDDGTGWGEPLQPETKLQEPVAAPEPVKRGAWGKELPKSAQPPKQASTAPVAASAPPATAAAPVAAPAVAPSAPAAPAQPAPKPKMTWAQIAKPIEKPKPAPPPPAPKAPEPQPEPEVAPEEPAKIEEEVVQPEPEQAKAEEPEKVTEETTEEPATQPEPVVLAPEVHPEPEAAKETAATAVQEQSWASDPAIVGSAAPTAAPAAPEPVTTYTGPPGFNTVASKAVGSQQPRTSSRGAHRFKTGGEAVVLPAQASGVSSMEIQFGNLSFGGLNGDGVETPVQSEEPPAAQSPVAHTSSAPSATSAPSAPAATATQQAVPAQQPSAWQQQQAAPPQPPASYPGQPQQTYDAYGQQQQQQQQQQGQQQEPHQPAQQQQQQQPQQSQYGYRQDGYYNPIGSQGQQGQQTEQSQQHGQQQQQHQQQQQQHQQQQPQQQSYDQFGAGGFSNQWPGQQQPQHNEYGHGRNYDSFSNAGYGRPPAAEEPKQQAPTPAAPSQPQQSLPHQQNQQYYSGIGGMGYYQHPSGPYNPYYQYGHTHNPGFQQYYPMGGRQLYGQPPSHQPPAPIPASKPTPPTHSPYGAPNPYPSSGFEDQSYGLGRFGDSNKASGTLQSGQSQQTPQPIGAGSLPQSGYQQQGLHNFLGGGINTPTGAAGSQQPNRPQAGTPEDSFKGQAGNQQTGAGAAAGARAQPQQPQTQQAFASYPYGAYQSHDWSPYGQQGHYGGSRNGGYTGWQQ